MKNFIFLSVFMVLCTFGSCQINNKDFMSSPHRISLEKAKQLKNNHQEGINPILAEFQNRRIDREQLFEPTEYVWVSLEDLKNYISMLETVAELNNQPISGIAINFGAYSLDKDVSTDSEKSPERIGDYRGRTTVFLNPTFYQVDSNVINPLMNHKQFYIVPESSDNELIGTYIPIENWGKLGNMIEIQKTMIGGNDLQITKESSVDDGTSLAMDELNSMPPKK